MEWLTNSSGWLAVTLSSDYLVTALSPGMEGFAGYAEREIIGRPIMQFLADETVFEMQQILDALNEEGRWEGDIVYRNRQGGEIRTRSSAVLLSGYEDRLPGYLLLSGPADLEKSEDGSAFTYGDVGSRIQDLVHDLNNPLAVVMGSAQLLATNVHCSSKIQSDIEKLYKELEKMVQVIEKLQGYAFSLRENASPGTPGECTVRNSA
jgi:signal transduction histidine kinase